MKPPKRLNFFRRQPPLNWLFFALALGLAIYFGLGIARSAHHVLTNAVDRVR